MICKLRKYTIKYPSSLPWYNSSIFIIELNATINYLTYEFNFKDYVQFSCHYTSESKKNSCNPQNSHSDIKYG